MKKSHWSKEVACLALAKQAEQTASTSSEDKPQELTRQNTHELLQVPWLCTCCFPNHGFPAGCYTKYISDGTCPRALCLAQCRGAIHILSFLSRKEKHPNANLAQILSIIITRGISRYSE